MPSIDTGKLEALMSDLESYVPQHALLRSNVSKGNIGWHIEHSLLTIDAVVNTLKKSDCKNYRTRFHPGRLYVLTFGKIPRGKVKAPAVVQPVADYYKISLQLHLSQCRENLKTIEQLTSNHFFTHPFLGDFKLIPAIKFLGIHTHHHVKIIRDIVEDNDRAV
jgi:hypothetical protein